MDPDWIIACVASGGVAFEAWRRWRKFDRSFQVFLTDWHGYGARPGVSAKAGVMERLELIELAQIDNRAEIAQMNTRLKGRGL
jgi:hypothetical protein